MQDTIAEEVLDFWLGELGEAGWYAVDEKIDDAIRDRFLPLWEQGRRGELARWVCTPRTGLALLIVLDQFPRNMFRGDPRSFATDARARAVAKDMLGRGYDGKTALPERQFFYMPLMHSEFLADQDRSVRLFAINFGPGPSLEHARAHRLVIRRFGRFPYRNAALGRVDTPEEEAFLAAGGYRAAMVEVGLLPAPAAP